MLFSQKAEETFAHGINIRHNYQLFHLSSTNKLLEKLALVNYSPISNDGNIRFSKPKAARLAPEFALKDSTSSKKPHCTVICNALNV